MSTSTALPPAPSSSMRGTEVHHAAAALRAEVAKRIVGLDDVVEQVLIAILTEHHALLEGVPGLAKTLLVSTIAELVDLSFRRIQFTPDLMPSDVTGSEVLSQDATGARAFHFLEGPIFANVILADEINRTPPKTQASLMEAMEERSVTSLGVRRALDRPFFVLATQNPIEQQGTYPLPAAQLDRFLFKIRLEYPTIEDEGRIVRLTTATLKPLPTRPVITKAELLGFQTAIANADVAPEVLKYAVELSRASRPDAPTAPQIVKDFVTWGVGPRAPQALIAGAKARAFLRGRARAEFDDVRALAPAVFRHRLIASYTAEADGVTTDDVTKGLLEAVPYPGREAVRRERSKLSKFFRTLLALDRPIA